uniref:Uncharacterized protein n=1 Tax=Arundo donax TaxID=35708 RepID=A0A0A9TUJ3_ARUDO
MRCVEKWA